jgi:hypothetical protein
VQKSHPSITLGLGELTHLIDMPILILVLLLCSCSPRKQDNNALPVYSDMGAASDLGATKP